MTVRESIDRSMIGPIGKKAVLAVTLAAMVAFFKFVCQALLSRDVLGIVLFMVAGFIYWNVALILVVVAYVVIAFLCAVVKWVFTADFSPADAVAFAFEAAEFVVKFLFGDWDRLALFKKGKA